MEVLTVASKPDDERPFACVDSGLGADEAVAATEPGFRKRYPD